MLASMCNILKTTYTLHTSEESSFDSAENTSWKSSSNTVSPVNDTDLIAELGNGKEVTILSSCFSRVVNVIQNSGFGFG